MDDVTILLIILACAATVTFLLVSFMQKQDEKVDTSVVPDKTLRPLLEKLLEKLEDMKLQDKQLKEKISSLQLMSGIEREQTKYLTANVNKTLYNT
jgi:cytochrome c-type biogenesis protein CcmH/NrfG